jgi:hypothetical protein
MSLPANLRQVVEQRLADEPELPWDAALAEILAPRQFITRPIR